MTHYTDVRWAHMIYWGTAFVELIPFPLNTRSHSRSREHRAELSLYRLLCSWLFEQTDVRCCL